MCAGSLINFLKSFSLVNRNVQICLRADSPAKLRLTLGRQKHFCKKKLTKLPANRQGGEAPLSKKACWFHGN